GPRPGNDGVDIAIESSLGRTSRAQAVAAIVEREHAVAARDDGAEDGRPIRKVSAVAVEVHDAGAGLWHTHDPGAQPLAIDRLNRGGFVGDAEILRRDVLPLRREEGQARLEPPRAPPQTDQDDEGPDGQMHQRATCHVPGATCSRTYVRRATCDVL